MKTLLIIGALMLSTNFAQAAEQVNLKKVNKVLNSVIQSELTPVINKLGVKVDERSNFSSLKKLTTAATLSATATQSAWSTKPTTVDVNLKLRTVSTDPQATKLQGVGTLGSKTEAVKLYSFAANKILKWMEESQPTDPTDIELIAVYKEATQTTRLAQIPAQLEKLVQLWTKKMANNDSEDVWTILVKSLVVKSSGSEVEVKTTQTVDATYFVVNELSFKMSETAMSLSADIAGTIDTENATAILNGITEYLKAIEIANLETISELKDLAKGYIAMAEKIINGEEI